MGNDIMSEVWNAALVAYCIGIAVLLALAVLASTSEVALSTLTPTQLRDLQERGGVRGARVMDLLAKPRRLKATLLAVSILADLGITVLCALVLPHVLPLGNMPAQGVFAIHVAVIVALLLLVGKLLPKAYATTHAVDVALVAGGPLLALRSIWSPLNELLVRLSEFIERNYRKRGAQNVDVDTLQQALDLTKDTSTTAEEQRILRGIVKFGNIEVRQVMRPRTDVVTFDEELTFDELLEAINESGFSRVPVYKGTADHIVGVLHIKDVLPHLDVPGMEWRTLLRDPWFVPENKKLDDLLKEFQERKLHLAVVVDEYGGTSGIVTLEDVIEEIVGDITDEYDDEELFYSKLDDHTWVFEGRTPLPDMYRVLGIEGEAFEESKGDSGTLGGFVLELTGRIPQKGERVTFRNFRFMVESADNKRLRRVKVHMTDEAKA
jgi:putative hemolysin